VPQAVKSIAATTSRLTVYQIVFFAYMFSSP
jgi:hypothetical protein